MEFTPMIVRGVSPHMDTMANLPPSGTMGAVTRPEMIILYPLLYMGGIMNLPLLVEVEAASHLE